MDKFKAKILLKQRLNFPGIEKIEIMDGLAIIKGQRIVEPNVGFSSKRND